MQGRLRGKPLSARAPARLVVALVLASSLGGALWWWIPQSLTVPLAAPPLAAEALWRLPGYMQGCRTPADCRSPLKCAYDARADEHRCLGPECETDAQCDPGYLCRTIPALETETLRLCLPEGVRDEGETCEQFPLRKEAACRPGLRCAAWYCGRPCRPEAPVSCPQGQVCFDDLEGPACVPSCLDAGCPAGQRCVQLQGAFSVCGKLLGEDCEKTPCPEGQECITWIAGRTGIVRTICERRCNEQRACSADSICVQGYCKRSCNPEQANTCGPQERCKLGSRLPPLWVCDRW